LERSVAGRPPRLLRQRQRGSAQGQGVWTWKVKVKDRAQAIGQEEEEAQQERVDLLHALLRGENGQWRPFTRGNLQIFSSFSTPL